MTTSMVYGCAETYLSSLADQHCQHLSSLIPDCGFTDAACCTTAYDFAAEEAKCLSPYAACMDFTSWTNDASSGLSECTAQLTAATTPIPTDSSAVPTGSAKPGSSSGGSESGSTPTITSGPTASGSSATATAAQSTSATNAGGRLEMSLYKVGVIGLLAGGLAGAVMGF